MEPTSILSIRFLLPALIFSDPFHPSVVMHTVGEGSKFQQTKECRSVGTNSGLVATLIDSASLLFSPQHYQRYRKAWLSFHYGIDGQTLPSTTPSPPMVIATVKDLVRYVGEFM
jgi:hypothetical protein